MLSVSVSSVCSFAAPPHPIGTGGALQWDSPYPLANETDIGAPHLNLSIFTKGILLLEIFVAFK